MGAIIKTIRDGDTGIEVCQLTLSVSHPVEPLLRKGERRAYQCAFCKGWHRIWTLKPNRLREGRRRAALDELTAETERLGLYEKR